jgi:hypothetical protein
MSIVACAPRRPRCARAAPGTRAASHNRPTCDDDVVRPDQASGARHDDEPDGRGRREPEQVEQPAGRDLFDHRGRGCGRIEAGVVVPTARQPVGRERGRVAAADDEPEVARSRDAQQSGCGAGREVGDHRLVGGRGLRRRAAERGAQLVQRRRRVHGPGLELGALLRHELAHPREQVAELTAGRSHAAPPPSVDRSPSNGCYVARRCFSSKIASIGPGSTSLSSAR